MCERVCVRCGCKLESVSVCVSVWVRECGCMRGCVRVCESVGLGVSESEIVSESVVCV